MLELFHHDQSTCSQKVRICLAEKGLSWVSRHIDLAHGENLAPEYLAINPNGVVPAFRHDGHVLYESTVMCEYLDEAFSTKTALSPSDPFGRARMRVWLRYIDEVPSMAIRVPSFQKVLGHRFRDMTDEEFADFVEANPLRKAFFSRMSKTGFSDKEYDLALDQLTRALARMNRTLVDAEFLCGSQYTIADACMTPIIARMEDLRLDELLVPFAGITAWYRRVRLRPSFDEAFYMGSRLAMTGVPETLDLS